MQLHCVSGNVLCKIKHQTDVSKHVLVEEHLRIIGNIFDISIIGKCLLSENVYYMSIIGKRLLYVYYIQENQPLFSAEMGRATKGK